MDLTGIPTALQVIVAIVGFIFTAGAGWWGHYVTGGASKAHLLASELEHVKLTIADRERREDQMFRDLHLEVEEVKKHMGAVSGDVKSINGKLDIVLSVLARKTDIATTGTKTDSL